MALLIKKIKASTLIEVIIAMIIVMISFGITLMTIQGVFSSNKNRIWLEAFFEINSKMEQTKKKHKYINEKFIYNQYIIKKVINEYENNRELLVLEFIVTDKNEKVWFSKKTLINSYNTDDSESGNQLYK